MPYIPNPKTEGSGIVCAIPQKGTCPNGCKDCFFQSGRSYLEPLNKNTPNMPNVDVVVKNKLIVRVNDGNDSNVERDLVIHETLNYPLRFYNTSIPDLDFPSPVVLTINPGEMTDLSFHKIDPIPKNLMFVRFRTNMWNIDLCDKAVAYYTSRGVPVVLTFMAYWQYEDSIPKGCVVAYMKRKRTLNEYLAITHEAWRRVMNEYEGNVLVHSCGTEGIDGGSKCKNCGNCLREYFATKERMRK